MKYSSRMRRQAAAATAALVLLLPAPAVQAWGFSAHKFITDRAIDLLPQEIRPFFDKYRVTIVEHSIDPDTYRTVGWVAESPRHFLDMDAWGPFPFTAIPHDYKEAVAKRGEAFVLKNGTLPWRAEDMYDRLVESFRQVDRAPYARDNIKLFSSVLSHYVEDSFQPLHANVNYDGQLTGQNGIHSRFETELFERYSARLHVTPAPLPVVRDLREFVFATLADSFQLTEPILAADRAAIDGRDEYDDAYFEAFFAKTQPLLERRLGQTIAGVAAAITTAWTEAGKPAVPPDAPPRPPRKKRAAASRQ
jgi:hypothetical protein